MKTTGTIMAALAVVAPVMSASVQSRQLKPGLIATCTTAYPANEIHSCSTLARDSGLTLASFLTINPSIAADCSNLKTGQTYCIRASTSPATPRQPVYPQKGKTAPGPTLGTTVNCDNWQKLFAGDKCDSYAKMWSISKESLIKLNPGLGADCSNTPTGSYICMRASATK